MTAEAHHRPCRPTWLCAACEEPYPCTAGRVLLVTAHGRYTPELSVKAVELMEQAIADLEGVGPADLWPRFLAWTAPAGRVYPE